MSPAAEWLRRSHWSKRTERFGELRLARGPRELPIVSMQFVESPEVEPLWSAWRIAPPHPALIQALEPGVLRYTAIDWQFTRLSPGPDDIDVQIARYGLALCSLYRHLIASLGSSEAQWFVWPIVKVDLEGALRVSFGAPSWRDQTHPQAFVRAIGRGLEQLVFMGNERLRPQRFIRDCLDTASPSFETLDGVAAILHELDPSMREETNRAPWEAIEQGIGAHFHRKPILAQKWMEHAVALSPSPIARDLLSLMEKQCKGMPIPIEPAAAFQVSMTGVDPLQTSAIPEVPVPRVFQNVHDMMQPTQIRERRIEPEALARSPDQQVGEALRRGRFREALDHVDAWLVSAPEEPRAHHLRGKALLALGRLPDARAAFDRACTLRPQLLEAMLLRREVDRVMAATQASAGIANPMAMKLPDHLADLRDALVSGRIVDAIQLLRRPTYDDDTVAQLLLAELLCTDDRHDDALVIYDRIATDEARLGKARALLSLARPADALDALASTLADEAYELRSRALAALGRDEEAGVQMSTYLRLIEQRSDRRIESR